MSTTIHKHIYSLGTLSRHDFRLTGVEKGAAALTKCLLESAQGNITPFLAPAVIIPLATVSICLSLLDLVLVDSLKRAQNSMSPDHEELMPASLPIVPSMMEKSPPHSRAFLTMFAHPD